MGLLQWVVKNDAMKSDPSEIYGWRAFLLVCSGKSHALYTPVQDPFANDLPLVPCFGGMLFGRDIGAISGILVMPPFVK
jgi:hypothetical protein